MLLRSTDCPQTSAVLLSNAAFQANHRRDASRRHSLEPARLLYQRSESRLNDPRHSSSIRRRSLLMSDWRAHV